MTVIAILLLAVVIVLIVAAVSGSSDPVNVDTFNVSIDTTVAEVFLAGVLTGLIALAALVLLRAGVRRARQRRHEVRELRRRAETAPAAAGTPATSETATSTGAREAPETRAADVDEEAGTHEAATDQRETSPPGDATDPTTEPHRS